MHRQTFAPLIFLAALGLAGCDTGSSSSSKGTTRPSTSQDLPLFPNETPELRQLINQYAEIHELPPELLHRLAIRESTHRPWARNGPYWGLFQILPQTARTMGHRGPPQELLDAETNLKYAGKYLRGAYIVADGNHDKAIYWYASGYYYEAKRLGLLEETGLR